MTVLLDILSCDKNKQEGSSEAESVNCTIND